MEAETELDRRTLRKSGSRDGQKGLEDPLRTSRGSTALRYLDGGFLAAV